MVEALKLFVQNKSSYKPNQKINKLIEDEKKLLKNHTKTLMRELIEQKNFKNVS